MKDHTHTFIPGPHGKIAVCTCGAFQHIDVNPEDAIMEEIAPITSMMIIGRRWFQKSYGNTYHTVEIIINGTTVHYSDQCYGYDDAYLQTALEWLNTHYLPGRMEPIDGHIRLWAEKHGIAFNYRALDVSREKDL